MPAIREDVRHSAPNNRCAWRVESGRRQSESQVSRRFTTHTVMLAAALVVVVGGGSSADAQPATTRASVSSSGIEGNGATVAVRALSADGRFVVFPSDASNLVASDTNGVSDVFVRDLVAGTTQRISVSTGGAQGNAFSDGGSLSATGRFVVFTSQATNLVAGDTNGNSDVFLRDRQLGVTERISVSSGGTQGNSFSGIEKPANHCSPDGRFVVFESDSTNLVAGDTNGSRDVFVRDRCSSNGTAVPGCTVSTVRVSVSSAGTQANGRTDSSSISADGNIVTFSGDSVTTNLVPGDTNAQRDVFVRNRLANTTERVSVSSAGTQANGLSNSSSISADGRFIAFYSEATNLVPGDGNGVADVFVRDRTMGETRRVSVSSSGTEGDGAAQVIEAVHGAVQISADGRFVVFGSLASNLVPSDTNGAADVFVHDLLSGATSRASVASPGGAQGGGASGFTVAISSDGKFVAFESDATNLVPGDGNNVRDTFVRGPLDFVNTPEVSDERRFGVLSLPGRGVHGNGTTGTRGDGVNTATGSAYLAMTDIVLSEPDDVDLEALDVDAEPSDEFDGGDDAGPDVGSLLEALQTPQQTGTQGGFVFKFARSYNSLDPISTLGQGWTASYQEGLTLNGDGTVLFRANDGQQLSFTPQGGGAFAAEAGVFSRLVATGGGYTLVLADQTQYVFDAAGRLLSHRDPMGNTVTVTRDGTGALSGFTDPMGRVLTVGTDAGGRIAAITLPDGRSVNYTYTGNLLTAVSDLAGETTQYQYDSVGRVKAVIDPNGDTQLTIAYDSSGRVEKQTDALGEETTFAWNDVTQVTTVTDAKGNVSQDTYASGALLGSTEPAGNTSQTYDGASNVTSRTDARGNTTTLTYDTRGNLLTRTAPPPLSYVDTYTYNLQNQLLSHTNGRGATTTHTYDGAGNLLTTTDPLGHTTTYTYNLQGDRTSITNANGDTTTYQYDTARNLIAEISPLGHKTTWTYDAAGRRTSEVEARGNVPGGDPDEFRTRYTYDDADRLLSTTDPLGHSTTSTYDPVGRLLATTDPTGAVTAYVYDAAGRQLEETAANGGTTSYDYDELGRRVRETDPLGAKTTYVYDAAGRQVSRVTARGNVAGGTPSAFRWTYAYDANGNQTTVTDPRGAVTTSIYDVLNRLTSVTDALNRTTTYTYDATGNRTSMTDPLGQTTTTAYDLAGRRIAETDAAGKTTTYTYDPVGDVTAVATPLGGTTTYEYDADRRRIAMVEPRGNAPGGIPSVYRTTYAYDAAGRRTSVTDPLGNATTVAYDAAGNRTEETDANGHTRRYTYDPAGRLASVEGADGAVTTYAYDAMGNETSRTDANGSVTHYTYDLAQRLVKTTSPLGKEWTSTYDAEGLRVTNVDPRGPAMGNPSAGTTTYAYDAVGRLVGIDYGDATPDVAYTLDAVGERVAMVDGAGTSGTEAYTVDAAGRQTAITRDGASITYDYDEAGRVVGRTYPTGPNGKPFEQSAVYDADGRMVSVAMNGIPVASDAYDAAGNRVARTLANGVVEARTYDAAGRVVDIVHTKGATVLGSFEYTYDGVGNPTAVTKLAGTETYTYDAAGRVTGVCYTAGCTEPESFIRYSYDGVGNRLTETRSTGTTSYAYDAGDQLVAVTKPSGAVTNYAYDAAGNETAAGSVQYGYDLANRLISAMTSRGGWAYGYDGNGRRLSVSRSGSRTPTTRFLWDPNGPLALLALELKGSGVESSRYIHGGGPIASGKKTKLSTYYHPDSLGSVRVLSSNKGRVLGAADYEPFGADRGQLKGKLKKNAVRFAGEYVDSSTGLYHLRARQYDPTLGRFLGVDPLLPPMEEGAGSAYAYVENRPTARVDPSGQASLPLPVCWANHATVVKDNYGNRTTTTVRIQGTSVCKLLPASQFKIQTADYQRKLAVRLKKKTYEFILVTHFYFRCPASRKKALDVIFKGIDAIVALTGGSVTRDAQLMEIVTMEQAQARKFEQAARDERANCPVPGPGPAIKKAPKPRPGVPRNRGKYGGGRRYR